MECGPIAPRQDNPLGSASRSDRKSLALKCRENKVSGKNFSQANLHHSIAASRVLTRRLTVEDIRVALLQEP